MTCSGSENCFWSDFWQASAKAPTGVVSPSIPESSPSPPQAAITNANTAATTANRAIPFGTLGLLLKDRAHHFFDAALDVQVVGQRPDDGHLAGASRLDPLGDPPAGVDEQAGADAFAQAVLLQVAHLLAQLGKVFRHRGAHAALMLDNARLDLARRVAELDGDEALAGAVFE